MLRWIPIFLVAASLVSSLDLHPGFAEDAIARVRHNLIQSANKSWELGAAAEALTELSSPTLSVFYKKAFPPRLSATVNASDVLSIANATISAKPTDSMALVADQGSAADPASIGVAVLLANWTQANHHDNKYSQAATDQLTYLLETVPRSENGAISHRANETQLWADFVYMVPPFMAYYGALQGNADGKALIQMAYDQCRLYRDALRDDSGLWKHVVLGSWQDNTHWATGNAWAAAGMLRVHQTLNHSSQTNYFAAHQRNLTQWIDEILEASWSHQTPEGGLRNVIDDSESYLDTASTALMASVTYRMEAVRHNKALVPAANQALGLIQQKTDNQGWLQNATNPYTFDQPLLDGEHSPEGQAFVLLLHAAWQALAGTDSKGHSRTRTAPS